VVVSVVTVYPSAPCSVVSNMSSTIVSSTPGVHNPVAVTGHSALREEGHDARMHSHTSNNKFE